MISVKTLKILTAEIIFVDWNFKITWHNVINMPTGTYKEKPLYVLLSLQKVDFLGEIISYLKNEKCFSWEYEK